MVLIQNLLSDWLKRNSRISGFATVTALSYGLCKGIFHQCNLYWKSAVEQVLFCRASGVLCLALPWLEVKFLSKGWILPDSVCLMPC